MIEVYYGPMCSGKSDRLASIVKNAELVGKVVLGFKPEIDDRFSKQNIISRTGKSILAIPVKNSYGITDKLEELKILPDVVVIDEIQFFDSSVTKVIKSLSQKNIHVIIGGLELDFMGEPFETTMQTIAISHQATKLTAFCSVHGCCEPASRTFKKVLSDQRIEVGDDIYEPRCETHWVEGIKKLKKQK